MEEEIDVTDSSSEEGQSPAEKDYKTMYENTQRALREEREKSKTLKNNAHVDVDSLIDKRLAEREKSRLNEDIETEINNMSSTDEERKAIKEIYDKRITPSGFSMTAIRRDLEDALLLANRGKLTAKQEARIKQGIAQENALKSVAGSAPAVEEDDSETSYSADDKAFLTKLTGKKY